MGAACQAGLAVDLIVGLAATRLTASLPASVHDMFTICTRPIEQPFTC